jgi:tRNA nucleotidyltransferase/poly(A) polymerase
MPDYIYLLENRLSSDQQHALRQLREAARETGTILFLTGDAVRDLTSGHAVRELEVSIHGNALKLKKPLEKLGGKVWGEDEAARSLFLCFPGTVRVDVVSAHRVEYPKPGKVVRTPASIQEDLRRRDFTANAMAISLNEGSFGLLMDPLNGAADIEARTLRLVSNYGFLEDPSLLIRATRYQTRLGWQLDPKTAMRYQNAKDEGVIEFLQPVDRSRELEQIAHEEEGLKVLEALEAEGWMKVLFPAWIAAKADAERLEQLHEQAVELLIEGVHPDMSAAQIQLLTAKLPAKDLAVLKKLMLRPGFVEEWNSLDSIAAGFQKVLLAKENQTPSACYRLFHSYDPEAILWLAFTTKNSAVKERYQQFLKVWPEVRQQIPHSLMQDMRITPELPAYNEIVEKIFLELIDGKLTAPEEQRAFLEPYSPPAPPAHEFKRTRTKRRVEVKEKDDAFDEEEEGDESRDEDEDLDDIGGDEENADLDVHLDKHDAESVNEPDNESLDEEKPLAESKPAKKPSKHAKAEVMPAPPVSVKKAGKVAVPAEIAKPAAAKPAIKETLKAKAKPEKEVKASVPKSAAPEPKSKPKAKLPVPVKVPAKAAAAKKAVVKAPAKPASKAVVKSKPVSKAKPASKPAPKPKPKAKVVVKSKSTPKKPTKPSKPVAKTDARKPAPKAGKKR